MEKKERKENSLSQKKGDMAYDLAAELSKETSEELSNVSLMNIKLNLKQKDVVDLWNTIIAIWIKG